MDDKSTTLLKFLELLWANRFTGQLRLNFHEGNLSEKAEMKESVKLDRSVKDNLEELPDCGIKD